ncbi:MAG TPA: VOC family protein [Caulobacteraceae bacterium]|nr:VOC family protein [Caulobacteraceae bacterium]
MPSPFTPVVFYRDPLAALKWLERTFGFETSMLVTDDGGRVGHAEMSFGDGRVGIGAEWGAEELIGPAHMRSPASLDGQGTQFIRVSLESGIDEHCARAEAAGARITQRPADQFYGARVYRALDLEGHVWNFDQDIAEIPIAEMEKASGLTIKTSL